METQKKYLLTVIKTSFDKPRKDEKNILNSFNKEYNFLQTSPFGILLIRTIKISNVSIAELYENSFILVKIF